MFNIVSALVCLAVSVYGVRIVKDSEDTSQRLNKRSWAIIVLR